MPNDSFFKIIAKILNPLEIAGYIKGAIDPSLSFIDSTFGYDDFELSYGGRPKQKDITAKKIFIFKVDNEIRFLTDEIISQIENKKDPSDEEQEIFNKGVKLSPDQITPDAYQELLEILGQEKSKTEPTFQTKNSVYEFLRSKKNLNLGYRYYYNRIVLETYKTFVKRFPLVVRASQMVGRFLVALCTLATSETGLRIASLASLTAMAVATGGLLPAAMVGLYVLGIGISTLQQANSRMKLNKLEEEANLLSKWIAINNQKQIFDKEKIIKKPPTKLSPLYQWTKAGLMHISTYLIETAVPLAFSLLFPTGAIISAAQKGLLIGLSSTGLSVGVISRKAYEDKKLKLHKVVEEIKERPDVPNYKNINELRDKLNELVKEKGLEEKELSVKKSWTSEYFHALKEVINPFSPPLDVKDSDKFSHNIAISTAAAALGACFVAPTAIVPAIATSLLASTTANIVNEKRDRAKINPSIEYLEAKLEEPKVIRQQPEKARSKELLNRESFVERLQKEQQASNERVI